jgi:hypothetical protein
MIAFVVYALFTQASILLDLTSSPAGARVCLPASRHHPPSAIMKADLQQATLSRSQSLTKKSASVPAACFMLQDLLFGLASCWRFLLPACNP